MNTLVKDPVCNMEVAPGQLDTVYLGVHYSFCSLQCQERFVANPHLYIGHPGHQAPKQQGQEILKRRRLSLDKVLTAEQADRIGQKLGEMMGIQSVTVAVDRLEITYDLLQATEQQIETKLAEIGVTLGEGWGDRLRRAFVQYLEECELGSLECRPLSGHASHK